ncbi:MAG: AMP-binding protein [Candidatus Omnitrophica bacterium]|nr:AMP-binding protein [Candidatus Omnitrophota bacterium]
MDASANLALLVTEIARRDPSRIALIYPRGRRIQGTVAYAQVTFQRLNEESDRYAHGLSAFGIRPGDRVLLLVPIGVELLTIAIALLKIGATLILIDPGMGKRNLLHCIQEVEPRGLIAVPLVHLLKAISGKYFRQITHAVTVGKKWWWSGRTHTELRDATWRPFPVAAVSPNDLAAVAFTTGSTGIPKGVHYSHGVFAAQIRLMREHYLQDDRIGLAAFPTFALYYLMMGIPCVLPPMNPSKPAQADPRAIIDLIQRFSVTSSCGSPMFWNRVSPYAAQRRLRLPSLTKVVMFGAPVAASILEQLTHILPEGAETYTPYGATEALPLTSMTGTEILQDTWALTQQGRGVCVGRALPEITLNVIRLTDERIAAWDEQLVLPPGQIGEIVVKGPVVTKRYDHRERETAMAKIEEGAAIWHRMGDVGYLDEQQRLWFCGRKNHRVVMGDRTFYPVPCESIFNQHPDVFRSALVGVGPRPHQRPIILIEPKPGKMPRSRRAIARFSRELLELGRQHEVTRSIAHVLFYPRFPVDFRHNAKIIREALAVWAERHLQREIR